MTRQVYRHAIPVDDHWHNVTLTGPIVHVDTRSETFVEFWAIEDSSQPAYGRGFRVYGTGHHVDDGARHVGTVIAPGGALVWHLFERGPERAS